jgi:hypothetical protein
MKRIIIIGGGAAGLMAAGIAAENGNEVIILEKNNQVGKKLLITGKGRCNLTNFSEVKEHISNIVSNGNFMHNVYHQYIVPEIMDFFEKRNVCLKIERGNRVFPVSDKAQDIVDCLHQFALRNKVKILFEKVNSVVKKADIFIIETKTSKYEADMVVICTGGVSYPSTGSSGDGLRFAKQFGHNVISPKPALVPLLVHEIELVKLLQGLSLRNVEITIFNAQNKVMFQDFGEMLFTHNGVSGPLILTASSLLPECHNYLLKIDLKPALSEEQLQLKIQRLIQENPKKIFKSMLKYLLPRLMIPVFITILHIEEEMKISDLTKEQRNRTIALLKEFSFTIKAFASIREAIITRGGVDVREIHPKTMESKLVKGLYFAGEIIDVDALTGGFNLQIAFSTGYVAGKMK